MVQHIKWVFTPNKCRLYAYTAAIAPLSDFRIPVVKLSQVCSSLQHAHYNMQPGQVAAASSSRVIYYCATPK